MECLLEVSLTYKVEEMAKLKVKESYDRKPLVRMFSPYPIVPNARLFRSTVL